MTRKEFLPLFRQLHNHYVKKRGGGTPEWSDDLVLGYFEKLGHWTAPEFEKVITRCKVDKTWWQTGDELMGIHREMVTEGKIINQDHERAERRKREAAVEAAKKPIPPEIKRDILAAATGKNKEAMARVKAWSQGNKISP